MTRTVQSACAFPPCAEFGLAVGAPAGRFCETCDRPLAGPRFGPVPGYRIEGFLGSGYYADVFAVFDLRSATRYAAKIYHRDPPKRQAAARETDALQHLSHPRLPVLAESFEDGEWFFVVMELIEGPNLRDEVTARGPLAVDRVVRLGIDACEVFEYLASQGWTYRDLHPKNVHRVTPKGTMLLDLDGARPANWPAQPAGRIGYRAPELEQNGKVSPACDVYSLAGCLYFALTGQDPAADPGPLSLPSPQVASSPRLAALLDQCRQADPTRRPTATTLRVALQHLLTDETSPRPSPET
jgi:serine/threonine protein kinase